ncbi:hypothetical protein ABZ570_13715 [Micromonospora sp. NPDC007271]|uniref:hypothetical protein n=1 Tax=Micromonospora sp. NPDC007271 TaxID=3154587 RepID=UPI0033D9C4AB
MEPRTRALPRSDLEAIFGVLVTVHGHLLADELPPDLVRRLVDRLTDRGPLPEGASVGQLNALLADLCQRMHWAMAEDRGDYPEPMPRRTVYHLDVPDEAVDACVAALTALGGEVSLQPAEDGTHPNRRRIAAAFPDLPPDPSHHARVAQLSLLATRCGGHFSGFGA